MKKHLQQLMGSPAMHLGVESFPRVGFTSLRIVPYDAVHGIIFASVDLVVHFVHGLQGVAAFTAPQGGEGPVHLVEGDVGRKAGEGPLPGLGHKTIGQGQGGGVDGMHGG